MNEERLIGIFIGFLIVAVLEFAIFKLYGIQHPEEKHTPNYLLNSSEWRIDTIKTIVNDNDTTITYKFVKNETL